MFTVVGEALLDLVQVRRCDEYVVRPGGSPLNIAVGLKRLDHETQLMARLSTRPLGAVVRRYAAQNGLALDFSVDIPAPATLAFASLDEAGLATYDFYVEGTADWGWTDAELLVLPTETRVLHTGSLAAAVGPGDGAILRRVERARAEGQLLVSFDPNVRPGLVGPRDQAVARVERFIAASHLVKASHEDLAWLYPGRQVDDVLTEWSASGPHLVVITRGANGCIARTSEAAEAWLPAIEVDIADTIGAGDAFMSGLLSGLADAGCLEAAQVAELSPADLEAALRQAIVVSALTCERTGADPPNRAEYAAYLRSR